MRSVQDEIEEAAAYKRAIEAAKRLLSLGKLTDEEIASAVGLTLNEIKALAGEASA